MLDRSNISLGSVLGVELYLDYSWFLIFALITVSLALGYFPAEFGEWSTAQYWLAGIITAPLFFASVILHELGHAVVANWQGVEIKRITLFIFGGAAQMTGELTKPGQEFLIAIAGPVVSIALAGGLGLLQFALPDGSMILGIVLYLAYINFVLTIFNLIPGFPLDGGRVLRSMVWWITDSLHQATRIAGSLGRGVAFLFIVFGMIQVLMGDFGGLWISFIGWFLDTAARNEMHQQVLREQHERENDLKNENTPIEVFDFASLRR